jgi:hypothetical protein
MDTESSEPSSSDRRDRGFGVTARALARETSRRTRSAAQRVQDAARVADADAVEATAGVLAGWRSEFGGALEALRTRRGTLLAKAASTRAGSAVGTGTVRVGRHVGQLPVLSLPRALIEQSRGVAHLTKRVRDQPEDPVLAVQLAEALRLMHRDMRLFTAARTVWNPYAPLVAEATKMSASLASGELLSPADAALRRAFSLAVTHLHSDQENVDALQTTARVYLATGRPHDGVLPAKLAILCATATTKPTALYTLGRLYRHTGHHVAARDAAVLAADGGCSLGWHLLADLVFTSQEYDSTGARVSAYRELLGRVDPEDIAAYRGFVRPNTGDLYRAVVRDQTDKAVSGYRWLATNYENLHGRYLRRGMPDQRHDVVEEHDGG